jgi:hypothetical protein
VNATDPVAVHWSDEKGRPHVTRDQLVSVTGQAVRVHVEGLDHRIPWPAISKVRKIT